jgi:hypothetical protein
VTFVHPSNEQAEKKIRNTIPFTIALKKYKETNLMKTMKEVFNENYKPLKNKIEDNIRRWKALQYCNIGRINTGKMDILPKAIYMSDVIPIKNFNGIFHIDRKINPQIHMETQKHAKNSNTPKQF